jgi:hypothetical protein
MSALAGVDKAAPINMAAPAMAIVRNFICFLQFSEDKVV